MRDAAIGRLTLGCLLAGFTGPEVPAWLAQALADGLAGVVLYGSNIGDGTGITRLTGELRAAAGRDVVVAAGLKHFTDTEPPRPTRITRWRP